MNNTLKFEICLCLTLSLGLIGIGCFQEKRQFFDRLPSSGDSTSITNGVEQLPAAVPDGEGVSGNDGTGDVPGGDGGGSGVSPGDVVCDPFANDPLGGGASGDPEGILHGLKAKMKVIEPSRIDSVPHNNVQNYLDNGTPVNAEFYFSQLYTPTRKFSDGFDAGNGQKLKDANGNMLVENFVLEFETHIRLPAGSTARKMQFALLADDGVNMYVKVGQEDADGWRRIVQDDTIHPTRMGCGVEPIEVSADQDLHVKVEYFQGPRYHIALTLMWRPWNLDDPGFDPPDPSCGAYGNSLFWDSAYTPSREQNAYLALLDRGWSVVPPEVFYLDDAEGSSGAVNPCSR